MAAIQDADEIQRLLTLVVGREIATVQVLGINSLKSMTPMPAALEGCVITSARVDDRLLTIFTADYQVTFDLQRTGKVVWLAAAAAFEATPGTARPTVRLILADGEGLDLTEPAKTKRIAVTISAHS